MSHERSHGKGIIYILLAFACFTLTVFFAQLASPKIPNTVILFFQNVVCLITVLPWLYTDGKKLLRTEKGGLILFRSFINLGVVWLSFLAVQYISLVNTMLLSTSSPLWIPFVVFIWRKIPINHLLWPGLLIGFVGIVLILNPSKEILQFGALFGLAAGIFQSINMVCLRVLSYTEKNHTVMFYYFLICTLFCAPLSFYQWVSPSFTQWLQILGVGVSSAAGQWAFVRSFHHGKASHLGPFCYSAVVYSVLLDWAFYHQIPSGLAWLGIALVCAGGLWALYFTKPDLTTSK